MTRLQETTNPAKKPPQGTYDPSADLREMKTSIVSQRTNRIALLVLAGAGIGFAAGGILGAIIGVSTAVALTVTIIATGKIYSKMFPHYHNVKASSTKPTSDSGSYNFTDVRIIDSTEKSFEWKKKLIRSAKHIIELSPNYAGGDKLQEILDLLEEKLKEAKLQRNPDFKVHLILSSDLLEPEDLSKLETLKETYSNFICLQTTPRFFANPFMHTEDNHVKLLIVDGKYFVVGGSGIHSQMVRDTYNPKKPDISTTFGSKVIDPASHDTDLVGYGKASASVMRRQFFAIFSKWEKITHKKDKNRFFKLPADSQKEKDKTCKEFHDTTNDAKDATDCLCKEVKLKSVTAGPENWANNPITNEITRLIRQSKTSIRFANLLFNPAEPIKQALRDKKKDRTGSPVSLEGNFNGYGSNSAFFRFVLTMPSRYNYHLLDKVSEYQKPYKMYHKKVAVYDKFVTTIGSYNLGVKSGYCDDEIMCVMQNSKVARLMTQSLNKDLKDSKEISFSPLKRLATKALEGLVIHVFAPFFG